MAEADAGLELPIGLTEQKFMQQLARIEARALKTSRGMQQNFVRSNQAVATSFGQMSRQSQAALQNVSYQLQDIFVQISSGQGVARALGQQLPQLLSGFGAMGAAFGLAASLAIPLASSLFSVGDAADKVADQVDALEKSIKAYQDAASLAATPSAELAAQFGASAGAARELYTQLAYLAQLDAMESLRTGLTAVSEQFGIAKDAVAMINAEIALGLGDSGLVAGGLKVLQAEYGITIDQARQLVDLVNATESAQGYHAQAQAALELSNFLADVVRQGGEIPPAMLKAARETANAALAALELQTATQQAADAAANVANAAGSIDFSGAIAGANSLAAALARASSAAAAMSAHGVFIGSDGAIQTNRTGQRDPSTDWRFRGPLDPNRETLKTRRAREAAEAAREQERLNRLLAGGGGGGGGRKSTKGRGGSGGSAAAARPEPSIFERVERDAVALQRQIELLGRSSEEAATAKARWELLDEAKRRGIAVNETLNAQIEAQAAQVGRLTGELERAEISQDQFETAIDGVADAMAGALIAGESLREGLAQVFKQIASDIINSGIRSALSSVFSPQSAGGAGGFGSFMSNLFGGFRAAGGPIDAGRAYVVGERGPEIIVPRSAGQVIPNHKLGGGNSSQTMVIDLRGTTGDRVLDEKMRAAGQQILAQARAQAPGWIDNHNKRNT